MMFLSAALPLMIAPILALASVVHASPKPAITARSEATNFPTFKADLAAIGGTLHRYSQALDTKKLADLDALFTPLAIFQAADQSVTGVNEIKKLIVDNSSPLCSTVHHFHIKRTRDYDPAGKSGTVVISDFKVIETCNGHVSTYGAEALDILELNTQNGVRVWQFGSRYMTGGLF